MKTSPIILIAEQVRQVLRDGRIELHYPLPRPHGIPPGEETAIGDRLWVPRGLFDPRGRRSPEDPLHRRRPRRRTPLRPDPRSPAALPQQAVFHQAGAAHAPMGLRRWTLEVTDRRIEPGQADSEDCPGRQAVSLVIQARLCRPDPPKRKPS